MTPTVGRIVHLSPSAAQQEAMGRAQCRAAIVTGIEYKPTPHFFVSAFTYRGDQTAVIVRERSEWHDPRECPYVDAT